MFSSLHDLTFDNVLTRELPGEDLPDDTSAATHRREVRSACYSRIMPKAAATPRLLSYSPELASDLGLSPSACEEEEFLAVCAGNLVLEGMDPHAMCYGGHQFGSWAGQLGDGRAINLGDVICPDGQRMSLQLKGAGETPYSRSADGLAVLRSSLREYLCSEAMHHLGVPTTRALSLVTTGEEVIRDMLYDGNPKPEPGAVVCRVSPSFLRFGNYEILAARGETELLSRLADHTIRHHFPTIDPDSPDRHIQWFRSVCHKTAAMVVHWMRVGFVHGVMNTDNMSILGLTIDYGPYGWLEDYDPNWTPNTTDAAGRRYRYGFQPRIAHWNLLQLANALVPVVGGSEDLEDALTAFADTYNRQWQHMMAAKLGFSALDEQRDVAIFADLDRLLQRTETDMTIFFRVLGQLVLALEGECDPTQDECVKLLEEAYYTPDQLDGDYREQLTVWIRAYLARLAEENRSPQSVVEHMEAVNPKYVLRNYLAQLAIDQASEGDPSMIDELLDTMRNPYAEQPEREHFAAKRPEWARTRVGCSMLSCSS